MIYYILKSNYHPLTLTKFSELPKQSRNKSSFISDLGIVVWQNNINPVNVTTADMFSSGNYQIENTSSTPSYEIYMLLEICCVLM